MLTVSHPLRLAPTGCTYCEFYLRCSHCVWLVPPVFALHVDHTYCVCTPYGSHLLCLHSIGLAPTVFALRMVRTYCVRTPYGSHLLCSHYEVGTYRKCLEPYQVRGSPPTYYCMYIPSGHGYIKLTLP